MRPGSATIGVTNRARNAKALEGYVIPPGVKATVPMVFLDRYGYDPELLFDFSEIAEYMETRTVDGRHLFDFYCPLSAVDGYGRHALDIWRGLRSLSAEAVLRSVDYPPDREYLDHSYLFEAARNQSRVPSKVSLVMSVPYDRMIRESPSPVKLVITQFESDRIPEKHIQAVSQCDHLITTSRFQVPIWRRGGLRIPIDVLIPGVDTDFFGYVPERPAPKFKVLILGALTARKNVAGAIRIFQEASQGSMDWQMTIKARGLFRTPQGQLLPLSPELLSEIRKDPRIVLQSGDQPAQGILQLYREHHCLLWPSKSEGVGLPPLEAMSTGMEVVISDNSGMSDYVHDDICWPIKMAGTESASQPEDVPGRGFSAEYVRTFGDVGNWWVPDERHGAKQLRKCFERWTQGKGKGAAAAAYVRQHHTVRRQAESVLQVVERYL